MRPGTIPRHQLRLLHAKRREKLSAVTVQTLCLTTLLLAIVAPPLHLLADGSGTSPAPNNPINAQGTATPRYAIIDLGDNFFPNGVNDSGVLVGVDGYGGNPMAWNKGMTNALPADPNSSLPSIDYNVVGIDANGHIVGTGEGSLYWPTATSTPIELGNGTLFPQGFMGSTTDTLVPIAGTVTCISGAGSIWGVSQYVYISNGPALFSASNYMNGTNYVTIPGDPNYWSFTDSSVPQDELGYSVTGAGGATYWVGQVFYSPSSGGLSTIYPIMDGNIYKSAGGVSLNAINANNVAAGSNGGQAAIFVGNPSNSTNLTSGVAQHLNDLTPPQVIGTNSTGNTVLWDTNAPSGQAPTGTATTATYTAKLINNIIPQPTPNAWNVTSVDGINNSGAIVGTASYTPTGTADPIPAGQHGVLLLPATVTSVSFDGTKYWQVESDDGATQYSAPQWADASNKAGSAGWDATASNANEHDNAVAYTRNSTPKIGATFKIPGATNWTNLRFKATGSDGISIPATAGTVGADGMTVTMPVTASTTALPNTIKYYNKADSTAFTLNWSLSVDGGTTWAKIASTKHTLYVTLGDPQTSSNQETIFYLGCENQGTQTDPATVGNTIFSEFTSLNVCRVGTTTGMSYWGTWASSAAAQSASPDCFSTAGLLKNGDGRCGAWANFLVDLLSAQGLNTAQVETIDPISIPASGLTGYEILVNNWNLSNLSNPVKLPGVPGQGNPNPQAVFTNHALVSFMGTLYDPSYGKKYSASSMSANHQAWEDAALAAIVLQDGSGNLYVKAHSAGTQQTTMSP